MNLCLDIGNTTVGLGLFVGDKLIKHIVVSTALMRNDLTLFSEQLDSFIASELAVKSVGIVSVVPDLELILAEIIETATRCKPWLFNLGVTVPLPLKVDNPGEVGADRALGSWYAYQKYNRSLIVVDFGTATTFDVVSATGDFLGGIIAPGVSLSFQSLLGGAAKLPRHLDFGQPGPLIGKNSQDCLRSAYYQGTAAMVKGLYNMLQAETGENFLAVLTGGWLNKPLVEKLSFPGVYEPHLLLEGLNRLLKEKYLT